MDYTFRPVHEWPGAFTKGRKHGQFRASYQQTLDLLEKELSHLNARNVVIQVALEPGDIRMDGRPRSNAKKPAHPGVIVSCDTKQGPLMFPCDTYWEWKDNLRAIALSLEALRSVDRYGVTKRGEQYKGWSQLPPASSPESDLEKAARFLVDHTEYRLWRWEQVVRDAGVFREAYQQAVKKCHPDTGGSHDLFIQFQGAADLLKKHHNGAIKEG